MNGVNPAVMYYDILLVLSALLSGAYLFMWRKHFDVRITLPTGKTLLPSMNATVTIGK